MLCPALKSTTNNKSHCIAATFGGNELKKHEYIDEINNTTMKCNEWNHSEQSVLTHMYLCENTNSTKNNIVHTPYILGHVIRLFNKIYK